MSHIGTSGIAQPETVLIATRVPEGFQAVLEKGVVSFTRDAVKAIVAPRGAKLDAGEEFVVGETIGLEWRQGGKKINASDRWSRESLVRIRKI